MEPYYKLANAIIETAVRDYKNAYKQHCLHPKKAEHKIEMEELERFFRSGWYKMLTDVDAVYLMECVRRMVHEEVGA